MAPRTLLPLLALLAACTAPPPPPPPPERDPFQVDRGVVRALGDHVRAIYDARLAQEAPEALGEAADPAQLEERLAVTRDGLRQAVIAAGADPAEVARDDALLPKIREGVRRGGRYAFLLSSSDDAFSLPLVRIQQRQVPRELRLFGQPFRYRLTVYDETLIPDYPTYRGARLGKPVFGQVATYRGDGVVSVDRAAARALGASHFLPQVESLRATAQLARDPQAFLARAKAERLGELLLLVKASLRWRSLEPLWSLIRGRGKDEQLDRFADDYTTRAELRAVAELRELGQMVAAAGEEPTDAQRQELFERGALSAIVHGEPLGQVADLLALTAVSLQGPRQEPPFRAARQLVLDLVARIRGGPAGEEADARALAHLSQASPDELREHALALYRERTAKPQPGGDGG